jgi:ABC-type polysaccharide/polyol phosphate export permease
MCNNGARARVPSAYIMGCLIPLLVLVLATLLAGPIGFVLALVLLTAFAIVTGTLHLVWDILSLPLRLLGRR